MPKGKDIKQTDETDILKLIEMAKKEIKSGKAQYDTFEKGRAAELYQIRCWIIAHSPEWRSKGSAMIKEEMDRLESVGATHY